MRVVLLFLYCSTLPLIRTLQCWVLSKAPSSTIFGVFGMAWKAIEPRSPGPYMNTLPISRGQYFSSRVCLQPKILNFFLFYLFRNNHFYETLSNVLCLTHTHTHTHTYIYIYIYIYTYIKVKEKTEFKHVKHCLRMTLCCILSLRRGWYIFVHIYRGFFRRRKWTQRPEFKTWTRLFAFHLALII